MPVRASTEFFLYEFVCLLLNFHKGFACTAPSKCNGALCEDLPPRLWSEIVTSVLLLPYIVMYLFIGDSVNSFSSLKVLEKTVKKEGGGTMM